MTTITISIDDEVLQMVNTWAEPIGERDDGKFVVGGGFELTKNNGELNDRLLLAVANGVRSDIKVPGPWLVIDKGFKIQENI